MLLGADGSLRPTIFAEMTALAARPARSTSGRASPTRTVRPRCSRPRGARSPTASTSTRPAAASPCCARRSPSTSSASTASTADPDREVLVTAGATEALAATLLALTRARRRGGHLRAVLRLVRGGRRARGRTLVTVPLRRPDFQPDLDELGAAVTDRTRVILRELPAQPDRRRVRREPCSSASSRLAERTTRSIVTDEVYEHLTLRRRARSDRDACRAAASARVTISTGGKTFSTTGWKVGWFIAPPELVGCGARRQAVPHLRQRRAVPARDRGRAAACPTQYFAEFAAVLAGKRDYLSAGLRGAGLEPFHSSGTYFVIADGARGTPCSSAWSSRAPSG